MPASHLGPLRPSHPQAQRLLGIDPGSQILGWGILLSHHRQLTLVDAGEIRLPKHQPLAIRLAQLAEQLDVIVQRHQPHSAAVESLFAGKNRQSPLLLAHARGVALMLLAKYTIPIAEYAPTQVKLAVTGHGQADKSQVQHMVAMLLGQPIRGSLDRSDALAVAICHSHHQRAVARLNPAASRSSTK